MTFKKLFTEDINVSNNNASKYFKMIQKATKSKSYDITDISGLGGYIVDFKGGVEDFSILVDTTKGKAGVIVGYRFGAGNLDFRQIPNNFTSVKDIVNDYKILKMSNNKLMNAKSVIKKAQGKIALSDPDDSFDMQKDIAERMEIDDQILYRGGNLKSTINKNAKSLASMLMKKGLTTKFAKSIKLVPSEIDYDGKHEFISQITFKMNGKKIDSFDWVNYGLFKDEYNDTIDFSSVLYIK